MYLHNYMFINIKKFNMHLLVRNLYVIKVQNHIFVDKGVLIHS